MSEPIEQRTQLVFDQFQIAPGTDVVDVEFFKQPAGINLNTNPLALSLDESPDIQNMVINDQGLYTTGPYTALVASLSATILSNFALRNDTGRVFIAAATDGFYVRGEENNYVAMTGASFTGLFAGDRFKFTSWGDKVLATNPLVGLYMLDPVLKTARKITTAPEGAQFISVLSGRVVLSGFLNTPARVQWSAKFDSDDWSGLGAGYEDLDPSPTGGINTVYAVFPYSDIGAIVLRQDSVYSMVATDAFDSPFRFSVRYSNIGCTAQFSADYYPGGCIFATYEDIIVVTQDSVKSIGKRIVNRKILLGMTNSTIYKNGFGAYNPGTNQYWFAHRVNTSYFYVYDFLRNTWTTVAAPSAVYNLTFVGSQQGSVYGSPVAAYSLITGTMELLFDQNVRRFTEMLYTVANNEYTYQGEVDLISSTSSIATRDINAGKYQDSITIVSVELSWFRSNLVAAVPVNVYYSIDNGANWASYSQLNAIATPGVQGFYYTQAIQKTITGRQIRFRIEFPVVTLGTDQASTILGFSVRVQKSATIYEA